ncbi:MAG: hypothetical protein Q7T33_05895 [Dehalococcoidia bacterium]|nr:hypothetical protein [Dehalococcoidia bacterium]
MGDGCGVRVPLGSAVSGLPQAPQKLSPDSLAAPHDGQADARPAPHRVQKR